MMDDIQITYIYIYTSYDSLIRIAVSYFSYGTRIKTYKSCLRFTVGYYSIEFIIDSNGGWHKHRQSTKFMSVRNLLKYQSGN